MFSDRFNYARAELAQFAGPNNKIVVFNAQAVDQISEILDLDITVVQGFAPSVNMLKAAGINVVQDVSGKFDCAIVLLPKSKPQARDLIAQAVACVENGAIIVDGQKNDGIDSVLKELKKIVDLGVVISKAHGKCASFSSAHDLAHWRAKPIELSDGFQTYVGVFSADEADPASVLLAQHVKGHLKGRVADFGAGWGYLTRAILANENVTDVYAVEADYTSVQACQMNCVDDRLKFYWDDVTTWKSPKLLDFVVMNPPFHTLGAADPKLGLAFIKAAARNLAPSGQLIMVANRHLPYETTLQDTFQTVNELDGTNKFKVFMAARPRKIRR